MSVEQINERRWSIGASGRRDHAGLRPIGVPVVLAVMLLLWWVPAACASGTPGGIAGMAYGMPSAPSAGLQSLTYPMTILTNASGSASWYWADEFEFAGNGNIAYTGLQPNGQYGRTALFSVFGDGTSSSAAGCATGADGGSGTSCHIAYPWVTGRTYDLTITLAADSGGQETWTGTVTDTTTLNSTTIGSWTVPDSWGLIEPYLGFSEYFSSVSGCSAVPQMDVRYGAPTGTAGGTSYAGTVTSAYSYGSTSGSYIDCSSVAHTSHTTASALVDAPAGSYDAPDSPTGVTATAAGGHVAVSWTAPAASNGIASYDVYRDGAKIATVTTPSVVDTSASVGAHLYTVDATDPAGQTGPLSRAARVTLTAPTTTGTTTTSTTTTGAGSTPTTSTTTTGASTPATTGTTPSSGTVTPPAAAAITPAEYQAALGVGLDVDWSKSRHAAKTFSAKTAEDFAALGLRHVRIRVTGQISRPLLAQLGTQVSTSLAHGLIPIITYTADQFERHPTVGTLTAAVAWWKAVAQHFGSQDPLLSFDLITEPSGTLGHQPAELNRFYTQAITVIHAIDPHRLMFIAPAHRSDPTALGQLTIPAAARGQLLAEWHFYASGPSPTSRTKQWTTGTPAQQQLITNKIAAAQRWSASTGIPTWVGAWMPSDYNNGNHDTLAEQQAFSTFMSCQLTAARIPFAVNADGQFYNSNTHTWIPGRLPVLATILHPTCSQIGPAA